MSDFDPRPGEWVQDNLLAASRIRKGRFKAPTLATFHHQACALLSRAFRTGIYNLSVNWEKAEFRGGSHPAMNVTLHCPAGIASWDFDHMTRLVIAAHDECIRVDLEPRARGYFRIHLSPRTREGDMTRRHPTIEQAVEAYRAGARPHEIGADA